eukprot:scaffold10118_cov75-Cyclotella_meneghiniana.AAC.6
MPFEVVGRHGFKASDRSNCTAGRDFFNPPVHHISSTFGPLTPFKDLLSVPGRMSWDIYHGQMTDTAA